MSPADIDLAEAAGWLVSARAAYTFLTLRDFPHWYRKTCQYTSDERWHTHHKGCYEVNLPRSKKLRAAVALLTGPAVLAGVFAWCAVYTVSLALAWVVTTGQPLTKAERQELEPDEEAVTDERVKILEGHPVVRDLMKQNGQVPHRTDYGPYWNRTETH